MKDGQWYCGKEIPIATQPNLSQISKLHKTWPDKYTLIWEVLILLVFTGGYLLMKQSAVNSAACTDALVLLATMLLTAVVWQAGGLAVARIHMVLNGIEPDGDINRQE